MFWTICRLVQIKIKLSLYFVKHYILKTYKTAEVNFYAFLILAPDGDEWSASRPGHFTPKDWVPDIHRIGGWVCAWAGLDAVEKTTALFLLKIKYQMSSL
jgi:hypothetical protein